MSLAYHVILSLSGLSTLVCLACFVGNLHRHLHCTKRAVSHVPFVRCLIDECMNCSCSARAAGSDDSLSAEAAAVASSYQYNGAARDAIALAVRGAITEFNSVAPAGMIMQGYHQLVWKRCCMRHVLCPGSLRWCLGSEHCHVYGCNKFLRVCICILIFIASFFECLRTLTKTRPRNGCIRLLSSFSGRPIPSTTAINHGRSVSSGHLRSCW